MAPKSENKDWLVRTQSNDLLGPYTLRELMQALNQNHFNHNDEICISLGNWISAQTLKHREVEEVTRTSTRNVTLTPSTMSESDASLNALAQPLVNVDTVEIELKKTSFKGSYPQLPNLKKKSSKSILPFFILLFTLAGGSFYSYISIKQKQIIPNFSNQFSESPFVSKMYQLIQSGEESNALNQLANFHQKQINKNEVPDYIIPYASLLITQRESSVRAKKLLDEVLLNPLANTQVKEKAHMWLGYLSLVSEDSQNPDRLSQGENHFLEALQLNPKNPYTLYNLGRNLLEQEKFGKAIEYFKLAETCAPQFWLIYLYKAWTESNLKQLKEADSSFQTALKLAPDRWVIYFYYATFLKKQGQIKQAENTLREMLKKDPYYEIHSPVPYGYYFDKNDYADYLEFFNEIMSNSETEEKEVGKLYIAHLMQGNTPASFKTRFQTLTENGSLTTRILYLKYLLDKESTQTELKNALSKLNGSLSDFGYYAYVLRAEAKSRLGQLTESAQDFQKAILLEPKSAVAHFAYANYLKRMQRIEEYQSELQLLISYHPNYIPAIVQLNHF